MPESAIPSKVKTTMTDLVVSAEELNAHRHREMTIALMEEDNEVAVLGCTCITDIIFYADHLGYFEKLYSPKDLTIIRATAEDPENLPYSLPNRHEAFVLCRALGMIVYNDMAKVTDDIESMIETVPGVDIDEFTIITGVRINSKLSGVVAVKIMEKREARKWENKSTLQL